MKRKYRKNLRNSKTRIKSSEKSGLVRTGQTDVQGEQHPLRERGTRQRRDRSDSPDGEETLVEELDETVQLLKRHVPYHESDHVLNIAYNALLGGLRLEHRVAPQRRGISECLRGAEDTGSDTSETSRDALMKSRSKR